MEINPKIQEILELYGIPYRDGLSYLLSVFYQSVPSYVPDNLVKKMMVTQILGIEEGTTIFVVPLFLSTEIPEKWSWVEEYRTIFKSIFSPRAGSLSTCVARMKVFFAENPDVRKEEVLGATRLYISNVSKREYLKTSHKFIYDGIGKMRNSDLEEWIERYRNIHSVPETEEDLDIRDRLQE